MYSKYLMEDTPEGFKGKYLMEARPQSSSSQFKDLASEIKELTDWYHRRSVLHHPSRAIRNTSALQIDLEAKLHYNLRLINHELLKTFAVHALTLQYRLNSFREYAESKVNLLCMKLRKHRQDNDPKAVDEAFEWFAKDMMKETNNEKKHVGELTSKLLKDLGKHGVGYVEAKRYFSFVKMIHCAEIDRIIHCAEMSLKDDKEELYRIQMQSEKTSSGAWSEELENFTGLEELHFQVEEEEMELDSQPPDVR